MLSPRNLRFWNPNHLTHTYSQVVIDLIVSRETHNGD